MNLMRNQLGSVTVIPTLLRTAPRHATPNAMKKEDHRGKCINRSGELVVVAAKTREQFDRGFRREGARNF